MSICLCRWRRSNRSSCRSELDIDILKQDAFAVLQGRFWVLIIVEIPILYILFVDCERRLT